MLFGWSLSFIHWKNHVLRGWFLNRPEYQSVKFNARNASDWQIK